MSNSRLKSLDPVLLKNWRWAPFLTQTTDSLCKLKLENIDLPYDCLNKEARFISKGKSKLAQINTWACRTEKLRYVRAACVEADNACSVLNLLAIPSHIYNLPFFGADFVTLPSGHLLALDLQPVLKKDHEHTQMVWERLLPLHSRWQSLLPEGGPIPKEAESFFSPGFLWTRIPLGDEGDRLIEQVLKPAYSDYLSLYLDLVQEAVEVTSEKSMYLLKGQKSYINYRANKDPARAMLTRFYGKEWAELFINDILFNL